MAPPDPETLTWDLTTSHFTDQEASMTDYTSNIIPRNVPSDADERTHRGTNVMNSICSLSTDPRIVTDDDNFHTVLLLHIQVSSVETSHYGNVHSHKTPH